jgi:Leucine-rich repeat (LRR) protein
LLNIQVLSTLPLLEELDFSDNEVSRLPSFSADCALTVIRGEHNLLTSLDALSGLKHLVRVYMDYNDKLSNINSLRHCKALREVHVYGTKVTDISLLADVGILVHYTPKT